MAAYAIRQKSSPDKIYSVLAQTIVSMEGSADEPSSRIFQTVEASMAVGYFMRKTLFVTEDVELIAELFLFGSAFDHEERFDLHFSFPETDNRDLEVFDIITGLTVAISQDDPRFEEFVKRRLEMQTTS